MQGSTRLDPDRQASWCCALPGYDRRRWQPGDLYPIRLVHMGAPRDYAGEGERDDWAMPREDPEEGGCPGSWYRGPFLASVLRYRRRPAEGGARVPNRHLDACDDWLVIEAVETVEAHEDAWRAEWQSNLHEKMRARRDAAH